MRILAIRGENLASLGQPFLLDFESEPLSGTGLFAITGETGSGKSTILDALCLALYGRYPRFAEQQGDSSPDPGGRVRVLDGSTILRRGAGRGYAEADFLGQDGQRYRARWEARRSRNRADGAIQDAVRSLYEIHAESLVTIATTKTAVQDAVHAKTGLTFEQFCRTVLLAQGEFDSFLLAPERERGDLLEKITGTEIYGRISRRVREGTKTLEAEVVELERQLTIMGLLAPAELETLAAELSHLRTELMAKSAETAGLQQTLGVVDALFAARERLAAAEQVLRTAQGEQAKAGHFRERSTELAAVETLRALWLRAAETTSALPGAVTGHSSAQIDIERATAEAGLAADELRGSQTQFDEAERSFKHFGPLWDRAAQLDAEVAFAHKELGIAASKVDQTKLAAENLARELTGLEQESKRLDGELTKAEAELAARAHQGVLADRLQEVENLLRRHAEVLVAAASAGQETVKAREEADELDVGLAGLRTELAGDSSLLEGQTAGVSGLREQFAGFNQTLLEQQDEWENTLGNELSRALHAAVQHATDVGNLAEATAAVARWEVEAAEATWREADAKAQASERQERLAELSPLAQLAEESLDQRTVALRSRMTAGAPCPVCGSKEHPYLAPGEEDALTALASELRQRRELLGEELAAFYDKVRIAVTNGSSANAQAALASRQKSELVQGIARLENGYSERLADLRMLTQQLQLPEPLESLDADAGDKLQVLGNAYRKMRKLSKGRLQQVRSLRTRLDAAVVERDQTQQRLTSGHERLRVKAETAGTARVAALNAEGESGRQQQQVDNVEEQLQPLLATARVSLELLRSDSAAAIRELRGAANKMLSARRRQAELSRCTHELAPARERKAGLHAEAMRLHAEAVGLEEQRAQTLDRLRQSRLALLGGEQTGEHRTRINNVRVVAQESLTAAHAANSTAKQHQTHSRATADQARERLKEAQAEQEGAAAAYNVRCEKIGSTPERADALLAQPTSIAATLRTRLEGLDRALQDAQTALRARQHDVDAFAAEMSAPDDRALLVAELQVLRDAEAALNQRLGQRTDAVDRDTLLRQNAAGLERDVQVKQEQLTTWQEVDSAIGSPNGDRFRLFAQSLTLEQLIVLANEHLDSFSKRYHLARSPAADLAIHVTDRDMDDEERPTRSLSGGERFLVSLALALALSGLEGRDFLVDTLFIDEGFGSLDAETLDIATTALESLHSRGRKVGVITHVAGIIEHIPVQVKVEKLGGGSSVVRLTNPPTYQ